MTGRARAVLLAAVGVAYAASASASVAAQTRDDRASLHVALRVHSDLDERLSARLRGQTSDLPIEVQEYRPVQATSSKAAATEALAHCRASHVDVVVWWHSMPAAEAWLLGIATCRDQRLLMRRIHATQPALSGTADAPSGALETAALMLRGTLSFLAKGGVLGSVSAPPPATRPQPTAASAPPTRSTGSTSTIAAPDSDRALTESRASETQSDRHAGSADELQHDTLPLGAARAPQSPPELQPALRSEERQLPSDAAQQTSPAPALELLLLLGFQQTWENARHAFSQPAIAGTFALGGTRFKLGLAASFSFGSSYAAAHTSLWIARHTLAAQARLAIVQRAAWSISSGLDLGALVYARRTDVLGSQAVATPSSVFAEPLLGAWLSAGARIGPLWIVLSAGLELLPWTPRFVYLQADGRERRALQLWPAAPRATLSLALGRP